jgi:putative ATP-dependent endonuclease of the OLD family
VTVTEPFARAKVGEGEFLGEIVRSGHGMQRSFLVSLLQVLASLGEKERPTLLLGFEEPELYQHPPQSKHLSALLERLSTQDTQVIMTTHSPYFVSSKGYEDIRLVVAHSGVTGSAVSQLTYQDLCDRLADALGSAPQQPTELMAAVEQIMQPSQTELFFCKVPILVEGPEDIAFITTFMRHQGLWDEFRRLGGHFVACNGKTNMSRPLAIAQGLGLSPFVIFDGDCDKVTGSSGDEHRRDNGCLLKLLGSDTDPVPGANVFGDDFVQWNTRILTEVSQQVGDKVWAATEAQAREQFKLQAGVRSKNPVLIAATIELLLDDGQNIDLLKVATDKLIVHCQSAS